MIGSYALSLSTYKSRYYTFFFGTKTRSQTFDWLKVSSKEICPIKRQILSMNLKKVL